MDVLKSVRDVIQDISSVRERHQYVKLFKGHLYSRENLRYNRDISWLVNQINGLEARVKNLEDNLLVYDDEDLDDEIDN